MIKYDITAQKYEVSEDLNKYIQKKLGRLDRFLPSHARKTARMDIVLSERKTKSDRFQCEVVLILPKERLTAKESTLNMFAAIDIVEAKLRHQATKYKSKTDGFKKFGSGYHRAAVKQAIMRRRFSRPDPEEISNPDSILNK